MADVLKQKTKGKNMSTYSEDVMANFISQLNEIKNKCLIHVVKELLGMPIDKETGSRITRLKVEGQRHYERYFWDYGKSTERFLMEWDLVFPELDINDPKFVPTIEVGAPVSLKGII